MSGLIRLTILCVIGIALLVPLLGCGGLTSYRDMLAGDYGLSVSGTCNGKPLSCSGGMHLDWEHRGSDGAFDLCGGNLSGVVRMDLAQTRIALELDGGGLLLRVFAARIEGTRIIGKISGGCMDAGDFVATRVTLGAGSGKSLGPDPAPRPPGGP